MKLLTPFQQGFASGVVMLALLILLMLCATSCTIYECDAGGQYVGNLWNGAPLVRFHR